jgi:hypothetical protein
VIQKKNSEIHIIDEMTVKVEETKRCWPHITDAFLFKLVNPHPSVCSAGVRLRLWKDYKVYIILFIYKPLSLYDIMRACLDNNNRILIYFVADAAAEASD